MSNIRDTDILLVNRSGSSFQCSKANIDNVRDTDLFIVNRSGSSFQCSKADVATNVRDTDSVLVNRSGFSYQATGADFKEMFGGSWKAANTQLAEVFTAVSFGNGKFIAATTSQKFYESTNGSDWTFLANFPNSVPYTAVNMAFGNNRWVAVGNPDAQQVNLIYSLNNGSNWTKGSTSDLEKLNIYDVVYGQSKFVLVAAPLSGNTRSVAISTDAISWNQYPPASAGAYAGITYSPSVNRFTAVAAQQTANSSNTMYTSDPRSWISVSASQLARQVDSNSNGLVRCYNNHVGHSTNGVSFTAGTGDTAGIWMDVAAGDDGSYMVIGEQSATFSSDGSTWEYTEGLDTNGIWNKVAYGNGVYVAVSSKTSSDTTSTRIMYYAT